MPSDLYAPGLTCRPWGHSKENVRLSLSHLESQVCGEVEEQPEKIVMV